MSWGLYDTKKGGWMGDNDGPKLFEDNEEWLARVAAQVLDVQLGQSPGRTQARPFNAGPLVQKETRPAQMTTEEALKGIEDGNLV